MRQWESGRENSLSPKNSNKQSERAHAVKIRCDWCDSMKNDSEKKPSSLSEEDI